MGDPYATLGVPPDADAPAIHKAYRRAVRRTHPDVGGSAAEFEAVQDAYETLRDPARRRAHDTTKRAPRASRPDPAPPRPAHPRVDDLIAESQRLENEARRLAGLPPRDFGGGRGGVPGGGTDATDGGASPAGDSFAAIFDDAQRQLREVAAATARDVRRRLRRML